MLRFLTGKSVLIKTFAILMIFLMALPLVGCHDHDSGLKEAYLKSMEIKSCRSMGTLSVTNNVPEEQLSPQALAVFSLLEKGLTMEAEMADITSVKMVLAPKDGDTMRSLGWNYPQAPSLEFFSDKGRIAVKTSADSSYLVLDPAEAGLPAPDVDPGFSAAFDAGKMQEKQVEKVQEFMRLLSKDFDFPFSRIESLGAVKLELPDGAIETQRIKIELDFEEILALATYMLEYMSESEAFKDYMLFSMREPLEQMQESGIIPPEELPSGEEMEKMVEESYQEIQGALSSALKYLHTASPAKLKKQLGLDLSAVEEYYLDEAGYIRKTKRTFQIKAEHEELESLFGTSQLDLTINSEQVMWDINEPVAVDFPSSGEQLSFFALIGDPGLREEMGEGPLSQLIDFLGAVPGLEEDAVRGSLILDLKGDQNLLNGEPIELAPAPYKEGETIMVPFRALAELAGGEVRWIPEESQACYEDGKVKIEFTSGSRTALVNGAETDLAETLVIKDGRFMVPVDLAGRMVEHFAVQDEIDVVIFIF
ncbi:MAG: copper amine oxidase N-terminal domain-containing protein [Firmicutes bacterium]|nr:copper amine oxidase N-terminal domain-containing protein [Bacillota bacterium]